MPREGNFFLGRSWKEKRMAFFFQDTRSTRKSVARLHGGSSAQPFCGGLLLSVYVFDAGAVQVLFRISQPLFPKRDMIRQTASQGRSGMNSGLLTRIDLNPKVMRGKPVIRDTRIPVELIVRMVAQRIPEAEILREYPRLQAEDIEAALRFCL